MNFREYIQRFASKTKEGKFYCDFCQEWINKQRWLHYKAKHRFKSIKENVRKEKFRQLTL